MTLLLLLACAPVEPTQTIQHPNTGLTVDVPESAGWRQKVGGLSVWESGGGDAEKLVDGVLGAIGVRAAWKVQLTVVDAPPQGCDSPRPVAWNRLARLCAMEEQGGGSGGTEYKQTGWIELDERIVQFVFEDQVEAPGKPNRAVVWSMLGSARFE